MNKQNMIISIKYGLAAGMVSTIVTDEDMQKACKVVRSINVCAVKS